MPWDYRKFGTASDPVRQSALGAFASQNGCALRYKYERDAESEGAVRTFERHAWRPALGTAVHAVIERALTKVPEHILAGRRPSRESTLAALDEALAKATRTPEEVAANAPGDASRIDWRDDNPVLERSAGVSMVLGALATTAERACEIVAVEAPFRAQLDDYHLEGTADLVYRPRSHPEGIALADWKTGERHAPRVILDKGYQVSAYSYALEHGTLWPGTEREVRLGQHPQSIHIVHLRDFVAYDRALGLLRSLRGSGPATSNELAARVPQYQLNPRSISAILSPLHEQGLVAKGKGPRNATLWSASASSGSPSTKTIWYESQRSSTDVARFRVSLKTIVGTARMGRFVESLGEQCDRCPFREQCLGQGYGPTKTERQQIDAALAGLDLSDLDGSPAEAA